MSIVVLGLNHKSAPVDIRERLAFSTSEVTTALRRLKEMDHKAEFVLLSTCNRVELYYAGEQESAQIAGRLVAFLSGFHNIEPEQFKPCLYFHEDEEAVRHLLMVASGLDSMVVGEAQILGQVKESYKQACAAKSTGKILNRLFHSAFFTAKSVHTSTAMVLSTEVTTESNRSGKPSCPAANHSPTNRTLVRTGLWLRSTKESSMVVLVRLARTRKIRVTMKSMITMATRETRTIAIALK